MSGENNFARRKRCAMAYMKALFFLRHYNDIDHITPVISKWIESGHHCDIVLVGHPKFRSDYRIEFLNKLDRVRLAHIRDLLPAPEFLRWRLQMLLLVNSVRRLSYWPARGNIGTNI